MIVCWSVKGGSGTTVVAAALARARSNEAPTLLVDLQGDAPLLFGAGGTSGEPGVGEWLRSAVATEDSLRRLAVPVSAGLGVVPRGAELDATADWTRLAGVLGSVRSVVDAGLGPPPAALHDVAEQSLLVVRPCFLSIRQAARCPVQPSGIVVVGVPGRALAAGDIERAVGVPVIATVGWDPAIARAVDAGTFAAAAWRGVDRVLRGAA